MVRLSNVLSLGLGLDGEEGVSGELRDGIFEVGGNCAGVNQEWLWSGVGALSDQESFLS